MAYASDTGQILSARFVILMSSHVFYSISRHFVAQNLSLGQRSLCSQVINFLLSDRSLGMPIHSLVSRGRATQLSFPSSHASLCDKSAAELQAHSSHVATLC